MTWVLLAGAIVSEVAATLALRASNGFRRRRLVPVVIGGYAAAFALLAAVLSRGMPVAVAYAIWAALGVAATAVLGRLIFQERISVVSAIGLVVIVIGVVVLNLGTL